MGFGNLSRFGSAVQNFIQNAEFPNCEFRLRNRFGDMQRFGLALNKLFCQNKPVVSVTSDTSHSAIGPRYFELFSVSGQLHVTGEIFIKYTKEKLLSRYPTARFSTRRLALYPWRLCNSTPNHRETFTPGVITTNQSHSLGSSNYNTIFCCPSQSAVVVGNCRRLKTTSDSCRSGGCVMIQPESVIVRTNHRGSQSYRQPIKTCGFRGSAAGRRPAKLLVKYTNEIVPPSYITARFRHADWRPSGVLIRAEGEVV